MNKYDYTFVLCDTDSVTVSKPDRTPFSDEEQAALLEEINGLYPELINWEQEGPYERVIVLRAKNYILLENGKITYKGSALKSSKMEIACRDLQKEIVGAILQDKTEELLAIYKKYIKEALDIKDLKRWASKKTYTKKIDDSPRTNETKIKDAIAGSNYKEGDKLFVIFKNDGNLCLIENFNGDYDKLKLCEKLYKSVQIFENVLDTKTLFLNYKLKKNQALLKEILDG